MTAPEPGQTAIGADAVAAALARLERACVLAIRDLERGRDVDAHNILLEVLSQRCQDVSREGEAPDGTRRSGAE